MLVRADHVCVCVHLLCMCTIRIKCSSTIFRIAYRFITHTQKGARAISSHPTHSIPHCAYFRVLVSNRTIIVHTPTHTHRPGLCQCQSIRSIAVQCIQMNRAGWVFHTPKSLAAEFFKVNYPDAPNGCSTPRSKRIARARTFHRHVFCCAPARRYVNPSCAINALDNGVLIKIFKTK